MLGERALHSRRPTRQRLSDQTELGKRPGAKADLVSDEGYCRGAECGGHLGPDGNQQLPYDGKGCWICHATAAHEPNRNPAFVQVGRDLRARAVDHDHLAPRIVKLDCAPRRGGGDASTELEDDPRQVVYSAFSRT
jgi:hypothetical protein